MNRLLWVVTSGLAVAVAVAVAGCGSSSTKTVTVTSPRTVGSTSAPATTSTTSGPPPLHLATFESPSGNIGCIIAAGLARCDIQHRQWSPGPRPTTCPHIVSFGQGLEVGAAGPGRLVCAGDTAIVPSGPKLAYGSVSSIGPFRCISNPTDVNCSNTGTGHGFSISIQSYRVF